MAFLPFIINSDTNVNKMFENFQSTSKMCYNEDTANLIKTKFGDITNDCADDCFSPNTKLVSESNKCISDCNTEGNRPPQGRGVCGPYRPR